MIFSTFQEEQVLWQQGYRLVCGVDEVGRGCFAGPVVTAAVIFKPGTILPPGIADSKLLSAKKRQELSKIIKDMALAWSIAEVDVPIINNLGIGKATQVCFKKAIDGLSVQPDFILIDAFWIEGIERTKQKPLIHGDQISSSIAAASIIAKVHRDQLMEQFDEQYPSYGFAINKGYGTKAHREAIKAQGLCPLHRTSFNLSKFVDNS